MNNLIDMVKKYKTGIITATSLAVGCVTGGYYLDYMNRLEPIQRPPLVEKYEGLNTRIDKQYSLREIANNPDSLVLFAEDLETQIKSLENDPEYQRQNSEYELLVSNRSDETKNESKHAMVPMGLSILGLIYAVGARVRRDIRHANKPNASGTPIIGTLR